MDKLAIILPVLNCLDYTKGMIPTIKTKNPYHLILINNGSTDGTREYFETFAGDFESLVINYPDNKGVAASWNAGIRRAILKFDCRYFFIPNNDVLLHSGTIDTLLAVIRDEKVGLCSATDMSGSVTTAAEVLGLLPPVKSQIVDAPDFSCFMLKKETIDAVGYFDSKFYPAYFEDNDYHYRLKLAGLRGIKTNQALYFHYGSRTAKADLEIKKKTNLGYSANRDYFIQKWGGPPGQERFETPFENRT